MAPLWHRAGWLREICASGWVAGSRGDVRGQVEGPLHRVSSGNQGLRRARQFT